MGVVNGDSLNEWVSEWLLFKANSAIIQIYHGENKLSLIEMLLGPINFSHKSPHFSLQNIA
jgi:hypothetical protein